MDSNVKVWEAEISEFATTKTFSIKDGDKDVARVLVRLIPIGDDSGKSYGLLEDLRVQENYRRRGYGQRLVKAAVDYAREHCDNMVVITSLSVPPDGYVNKMYVKAGFHPLGRAWAIHF